MWGDGFSPSETFCIVREGEELREYGVVVVVDFVDATTNLISGVLSLLVQTVT